MGVRTRVQMVAEVAADIGRSDLSTSLAVWAYQAVLDLATYRKFPDNEKKATLSLASGATTATVPTDFNQPLRIEYDDGSSIKVITFKDLIFVRNNYAYDTPGFPDYFGRTGALFYFDRTADQAYSLDLFYRYIPADFSGDSSTSPFGPQWDHAIILWMTSRAYLRLREFQLAEMYKQHYYSYVKGRLGSLELSEEAYNETFAGDIEEDPYGF